MGLKPLVACLLLSSLALAGCSGGGGDGDGEGTSSSASRSSTATSTGPANRPPVGNAGVAVNGTTATFALNGTDPDGDPLSWSLSFGDGASENGTAVPSNVTHEYAEAGVFNATFRLSDGLANMTYNLTVNVTLPAAGPVQGPVQLTGSVMCLPTVVVGSEIAGGSHEFVVEPGQAAMAVALSYDDPSTQGVVDLDIIVGSADGGEETSENSGPEPPLEFEDPAAGTWTVTVVGYSCLGTAEYTVDVTFS